MTERYVRPADEDGRRIVSREESIDRRASHRKTSREALDEHGVTCQVRNDGAHLIVLGGDSIPVADLWPGTGKYNLRNSDRYGRGVFNLLRDLGIERVKP